MACKTKREPFHSKLSKNFCQNVIQTKWVNTDLNSINDHKYATLYKTEVSYNEISSCDGNASMKNVANSLKDIKYWQESTPKVRWNKMLINHLFLKSLGIKKSDQRGEVRKRDDFAYEYLAYSRKNSRKIDIFEEGSTILCSSPHYFISRTGLVFDSCEEVKKHFCRIVLTSTSHFLFCF